MIKPDSIIMHFSEVNDCTCDETGFKKVDGGLVHITLDLDHDEYVFKAKCPGCGNMGVNRRRVFK